MISKPTLDQRIAFLGMRRSYSGSIPRGLDLRFDLERDLIAAIAASKEDFRLLSLLKTWFMVHSEHIIIEKFFKLISKEKLLTKNDPILMFLMATAINAGSHKWKRWLKVQKNKSVFPLGEANHRSAIKLKGRDEALARIGVMVQKGFMESRSTKVLEPKELCQLNHQYRNRLLYGANWRSDIISAIEYGAENPYRISRMLGCGYQSCYRVMKEYLIAKSA